MLSGSVQKALEDYLDARVAALVEGLHKAAALIQNSKRKRAEDTE